MTAFVAGFRRFWAKVSRALAHPAVMPGIAIACGVFVSSMCMWKKSEIMATFGWPVFSQILAPSA